MFSSLYQRIAFSAVLRRCFVGIYVVSLIALGANEVRGETTIVASTEGSQSPAQASSPATVPNGDFTIEGTAGIVGDGIDERTTWTFDFGSDADLALFDPARGLSSVVLTLRLTPRNLDIATDFVAIQGLPPISSSEIQGLSAGTAATVTLELLDFPGYGQSEILSVLADDNVIPMIYADDALVSGASLALTQSDAVSSGLRYEAVWHSGEQPSLHTAPLTLEAFLATGQQLAENNESPMRLIDVETAIVDGGRVYAGLWTSGTGTNLFEGPMGPISMREAIRRNSAQNRHLVDFEVFPTLTGGRRYLGVWVDGAVDQTLTGPMEEAAFFARGEQEAQAGKRLVDVELFQSQGTLLYNGLFQTGSGSNFLTAPLTRGDFTEERDRLVAEGLELVDFERVATADGDRFVGVWASGDGESRISLPREFQPYFIFAQSQFNDDKHTEDFELQQASGDETDPPPPNPADPSSVLPDNPPGIALTGAQRLVIEWSGLADDPFTMELPQSWLPNWLPHKSGEPLLPDTFCALNVRRADSIFWQVPGNPQVETPPFLAIPSVEALGSDFHLGGVRFAGPFGACHGTQTEFQFLFPFTTGEVSFEPLANMRLMVEGLAGGSGSSTDTQISFINGPQPEAELPTAFELWEDDTLERLHEVLETFAELFGGGEDIEDYCLTVGNFWTEVCEENPAACPIAFPTMPNCTP